MIVLEKEFNNWLELLAHVHETLQTLKLPYEILAAAAKPDKTTRGLVEENHCTLISASTENYGILLRTAIHQASGSYILTIDADQTKPGDLIRRLGAERGAAEITIGSRYRQGGSADMPGARKVLSRFLNLLFSRGLDLQVRDISSAFRLDKSQVLKTLVLESRDYEILQEILVRALIAGYRIGEIPFHYRSQDDAFPRALRFGWSYLKTFARLWKLRNSIASADYAPTTLLAATEIQNHHKVNQGKWAK